MSGSSSNCETKYNDKTTESSLLSLSVDLMHPEILPCTTLRELFKERGFGEESIHNLDKAALVQLFYKTIMPLPQRKYRSNREGTKLTQKQAQKRAVSGDEVADARPVKKLASTSSRLNGSQIISLKKEGENSPKQNPVRVNSTPDKNDETVKGNRVIKLINRTLQGEVDKHNNVTTTPNAKNTSQSSETKTVISKSETPPSGKKHARITWP